MPLKPSESDFSSRRHTWFGAPQQQQKLGEFLASQNPGETEINSNGQTNHPTQQTRLGDYVTDSREIRESQSRIAHDRHRKSANYHFPDRSGETSRSKTTIALAKK
jgi:hypothetical protein